MTKKTKVFWTLEEEDLVCKQYELMVKTNNLKDSIAASWHFAQQMLKPDRRKSLSNTQLQLERFHAWQKDGIKALIRERKPRKDKPRTAAKARQAPGPVNVLTGQSAQEALAPPNMKTVTLVDQYVAGTLPGSPAEVARLEARKELMGTITIDGLLSELVARAAVQALVPMTAEMKGALIEVVNEFAQMLADHKSVIEGMLEDNYVKLTNFWNSPVNEPKQAAPVEVAKPPVVSTPIVVTPVDQLKNHVQTVLEKIAAQVPAKPAKPRVYVAGAKPWVKQLSERMQHVDIICGDDKNPRNIGTFDLVITTRFIDHSAAGNLKHNHANYVHVPKGGITRVEATINNWLRMNRKA